MNKEKEVQFWTNDGGKSKILQAKLIEFIESCGFVRVKLSKTNFILAKMINNRISQTTEGDIIGVIRDYLKNKNESKVYETFASNVGGYISSKKLDLLTTINLIEDKDEKHSSLFYFQNGYCQVTKEGIEFIDYKLLPNVIWEENILNREINKINDNLKGHFEIFCLNLSKGSNNRFLSLKTTIGYLLHRNKEYGEQKAVILYDELMGLNNSANGGTGKTLLGKAISELRNTVFYDGKNIKKGSWFINQRIDFNTNVAIYDDLAKDYDFENFFPMITSAIEVERKRQDSFQIDEENTPKILISSNYYVKGPGGNSDFRRRHEFEIANYYNSENNPEKEFGNRFFGKNWSAEEWNKFDFFMMECVSCYFNNGLIQAEPLNIHQNMLSSNSCKEFIEYSECFPINEWIDKRVVHAEFVEIYPEHKLLTINQFSKWIQKYADDFELKYETKSSGGKNVFCLMKKEIKNAS
jgi:hypothetical protein